MAKPLLSFVEMPGMQILLAESGVMSTICVKLVINQAYIVKNIYLNSFSSLDWFHLIHASDCYLHEEVCLILGGEHL